MFLIFNRKNIFYFLIPFKTFVVISIYDGKMTEEVKEDIVNLKFAWRVGVVKKNLAAHYPGVSIDDLNNYMPCGSSATKDNLFKLMFGGARKPWQIFECICGQAIQDERYICPIDDQRVEKIIVVGNECISKWADHSIKGRRCEECKAIHKNISFNLCNEHIKIKKNVSNRFYKILENPNIDWNFISKFRSRQKEQDKKILLKMFKQFKINWAFKYCNVNDGACPLNAKLRSYMQYIIDNRKSYMPIGKFRNRTYNEFYKHSTEYHKHYFMKIIDPDEKVRSVADYIVKCECLRSAGYVFDIPPIVRLKFVYPKVVTDVREPEPEPTKVIPELDLLRDEEMHVIKQNDKRKYEESYCRK